ncbi:MAG: TerD family protein [Pseudomonadota bacterium]
MTQIARGEKGPLNQSQKSKQRIIAGLSWDAREDKVGMVGRVLKHDSQHDLDLSCYIYNKSGEFIDFVGPEAQDSMDESGKIYHSGDDMSGEGEGDDERIAAELAELPYEIHGMVFLVEISSNHVFADVESPTARIGDSFTETDLLSININHDGCADKTAFVMAAVYLDNQSSSGWNLHHIADYPDITQVEDWGSYLSRYIA